jgi:quercetin dioxygenase-like cupin family protein
VSRVSPDGTVGHVPGSALELGTTRLATGASVAVGDMRRDTLLFGSRGVAVLDVDGTEHPVDAGAAVLVPAGSEAMLSADDEATVVRATIGDDVDLHAPMGAAEPVTRLESVEPGQATGARSFQVLYGPHNGSVRATLFVGYIPPGKAPWHFHLYDEIVWVLRGHGRLHLREAGTVEELAAGCAFRLRPREVHIVENLSESEELAVLGLFTPAGSPSAAYLEPGVLAEYRIG